MAQDGASGLPSWGIAAQVKASRTAVETFVAHHLDLGADWICIFFDDPDDPAADALTGLGPRVVTYRCDAAHWSKVPAGRPDRKTIRQSLNASRAYRLAPVNWLAHIDVDEFIVSDRPLPEILAEAAPDQIAVRIRPCEALTNPDGTPARHFRLPIPGGPDRSGRMSRLYGPHRGGLTAGMISHANGKGLYRTGVKNMAIRIHYAFHNNQRVGGPLVPGLNLLHYHAVDIDDWLGHIAYRGQHGAYSGDPERQAFYLGASPEDLRAFHAAVQTATPELLDKLANEGLLLSLEPGLEAAHARHFGPTATVATAGR